MEFINAVQAASKNAEIFPLIEKFIFPYEHTCVQLASHIRHKSPDIYIIFNGTNSDFLESANSNSTENFLGIIFFDKTLLHCIPDTQLLACEAFKTSFAEFSKKHQVKCINGQKTTTDFFIECFNEQGIHPFQIINYKLMTLQKEPLAPPETLSCDDEIKRCTIDDEEILLDLQKKYLIKEVAPNGKEITNLQCAATLTQILKNQLCYALFTDGEPVAKANTNAIGFNWGQLGGIYTHPLYRKNYYAWHLIYKICTRFFTSQKKLSLFVKENNNPAISLYKKIGFCENGRHTIAYF